MGSDPLIQIGNDLVFRAPTPALSVNYDRISFVQFGATVPSIDSYLDNVVVTPIPTPGAAALLGVGGLLALRRRRA